MHKSYKSLPPEKATHSLKAHAHILELLNTDALTESQQQALIALQTLTDCKLDDIVWFFYLFKSYFTEYYISYT